MRASLKALIAMGLGGTASLTPSILEVQPPSSWSGTATASTYQENPSVFNTAGDFAWQKPPILNMDFPELYPFDPATSSSPLSNVFTVVFCHGDPSGKGLRELEIFIENVSVLKIPGALLAVQVLAGNAYGGVSFRLTQAIADLGRGAWGPTNIVAVGRPYNGPERVVQRIAQVDHFNQRPSHTLDITATVADESKVVSGGTFNTFEGVQRYAQEGAKVTIITAGDYRTQPGLYQSNAAWGNGFTTGAYLRRKMLTIQAASGLQTSSILIGLKDVPANRRSADVSTGIMDPTRSIRGNFQFKTNHIHMRGLKHDFTGMSAVTAVRGSQPAAGSGFTGYYPNIIWESSILNDDEGPCGVKSDPSNNIAIDPEDNPTTGVVGGFGFYGEGTLNYPVAYSPFGGDQTAWMSFINCSGNLTGLRSGTYPIHFLKGNNFKVSFDSVIFGNSVGRGRVRNLTDGTTHPVCDQADAFFLASSVVAPGANGAVKSRYHDTPTVRVKSAVAYPVPNGSTSIALTWTNGSNTSQTLTSTYGFARITFDTNIDGTVPRFGKPIKTYTSTDPSIRFVSPDMAGIFVQTVYGSKQNSIQGWTIAIHGVQNGDVSIGGVTLNPPLAANEMIILGDCVTPFAGVTPGVSAGTVLCAYNPDHTDPMQFIGPTSLANYAAPNIENILFWAYDAYGPGYGNFQLLQMNGTAPTPDVGAISCDQSGNFTVTTAFATQLYLGDAFVGADATNYPDQRGNGMVVASLSADRKSGTVSRSFIGTDANLTPINVPVSAPMSVYRFKTARSIGWVFTRMCVGNKGQNGGGLENCLNIGVEYIGADTPIVAGTAVVDAYVFRESVVHSDFGVTAANPGGVQGPYHTSIADVGCKIPYNSSNYFVDPRGGFIVIDCAMNGTSLRTSLTNSGATNSGAQGLAPSWFAFDPLDGNGKPISQTAVASRIDYSTYPKNFPTINGITRRIVRPAILFDGLGNPRSAGSLLGALAS